MRHRLFGIAVLALAMAGARPAMADPIPVSCGAVISSPGKYRLSGNCTGAGILIMANDVDLNLNQRTLTLSNADDIAIYVAGANNVHIHDGNLANVRGGVYFDGTNGCRVDHVRVDFPAYTGDCAFAVFNGGSKNRIEANTAAQGAGGGGFNLISVFGPGSGNMVTSNSTDGGYYGILVAGASNTTVKGNSVKNAANGIYDSIGWTDSLTGNNVSSCGIAITLDNCSSVTVRDNTLQGYDFGLLVSSGGENILSRNSVSGSYLAGIYITYSFGNRLEGNNLGWNTYGIYIDYGAWGNGLKNNFSYNNSEADMADANDGPPLPNTWTGNWFATSNWPGVIK